MRIIDLTLELGKQSLSYPGTSAGLLLESVDSSSADCTLSQFSHLDPHCGTHLDAPLHFTPGGADVATLPLIFPEIIVVSSPQGAISLDALPDKPDIAGKAVLFATGWERHAGTQRFFESFPYLDPHLAEQLADLGPALVGLDSPSVDDQAGSHPAHRLLLSAGIPIVEGLINLAALQSELRAGRSARLAAFPLRIRALEGSPVRAVAIIE